MELAELLAVAVIVFIAIPAPIFIVLHFITKWKQSREISGGDEKMLEDMWRLAQKLEARVGPDLTQGQLQKRGHLIDEGQMLHLAAADCGV